MQKEPPTLYRDDCMKVFPRLANNSIDLIATDPPYFLDGLGEEWSDVEVKRKQAKAKVIGGLPVGMKFDPEQGKRLQKFYTKVSDQAMRVLKPGGFFISFSQGRLYHRMAMAAEDAGFEVRDLLIWEHQGGQGKAFKLDHFIEKMNLTHNEGEMLIASMNGRKTPQLRPKFEAILLAQKPRQGTFLQNWKKWEVGLIKTDFSPQQTTIFDYKKSRKSFDHLTPKPVDLMERLIEVFSLPGQTVLDPFMGSGTTGVAALKAKRKFVGCEIEQRYYDFSAERMGVHGKA